MNRYFRLMVRSQLVLAFAIMATSLCLWFPRWHSSETSEEGAYALWGFPAPMVRAGLFYAFTFTRQRQSWVARKAYIYQNTSPTDQPQVYPLGILANLAIYAGFSTGAALLIWPRQTQQNKSASNKTTPGA